MRVRTADGERPIESLAVGDLLVVVDPVNGARGVSRLCAIRTARRETIALSTATATLRCTSDHPLYDPLARQWAPAGDWALGHRTHLLAVSQEAVQPAPVLQRVVDAGVADVFDLTVEGEPHTFVAEGLVVHNKSPLPPTVTCNVTLWDGGQRQPTFTRQTPSLSAVPLTQCGCFDASDAPRAYADCRPPDAGDEFVGTCNCGVPWCRGPRGEPVRPGTACQCGQTVAQLSCDGDGGAAVCGCLLCQAVDGGSATQGSPCACADGGVGEVACQGGAASCRCAP